MAKDRLNRFVIYAQPVQIRRQPATKRVPAMPLDASRLENRLEGAPMEVIQRERLAYAVRKDRPGGWIAARSAMLPQPFGQHSNDRHRRFLLRCLRLSGDTVPDRLRDPIESEG